MLRKLIYIKYFLFILERGFLPQELNLDQFELLRNSSIGLLNDAWII